jgi:hypothetical protein
MNICAARVRFLVGLLPFVAIAILAAFYAKTSTAQKPPTTTFYTHGRIYTNDPEHPWAEAMAVSEGKISCIGKMDHVLTDCGGGQENAETVNLKGQFVMPGFNDAHVHLGGAAADELAVPLTGVPSRGTKKANGSPAAGGITPPGRKKDFRIASNSIPSR